MKKKDEAPSKWDDFDFQAEFDEALKNCSLSDIAEMKQTSEKTKKEFYKLAREYKRHVAVCVFFLVLSILMFFVGDPIWFCIIPFLSSVLIFLYRTLPIREDAKHKYNLFFELDRDVERHYEMNKKK